MKTTLQGTNLDLNDRIRDFVDRKVEEALKVVGNMDRDPLTVDVELEKTTRKDRDADIHEKFRAEVNVGIPGRLIRAEKSAADLEQAITAMSDALKRELKDWHDRLIDEKRKGGRKAKEMLAGKPENPPKDVDEWEEYEGDKSPQELADEVVEEQST